MDQVRQKKVELSKNLALLPAYYFKAIELKYEGVPYKDIADEINARYSLNINAQIIKNWFWKKGYLKPMYDEYAIRMNEQRMEEAQNLFKAHTLTALATLIREMKKPKGGMSSVVAAEKWLERALGKVTDKTENKNLNIASTLQELFEMANEPESSSEDNQV